MLLLVALASALLILCVSFDAFNGCTAWANRRFYRAQNPVEFWGVLGFYLLGSVALLVVGILSIAPDCAMQGDGTCTVSVQLSGEPQP